MRLHWQLLQTPKGYNPSKEHQMGSPDPRSPAPTGAPPSGLFPSLAPRSPMAATPPKALSFGLPEPHPTVYA